MSRIATYEDKDKVLDALVREEPGPDLAELGGNPLWAAGVSFFLFAVGAIFPAVPFYGRTGNWLAFSASVSVSWHSRRSARFT